MSNTKNDWWSSAIRMVRNYPARKSEYEALHSQSLVADMTGMPKGGSASRTTENIALRQMPPMKQQEYEAVSRAVEITRLLPNGDLRLELIRRMYWQGRKLRINDAIVDIGIAEATGRRWHASFIRLVGQCVGYTE
ncbi:MAG: hypothetical protein IJ960_06800 [Oscillospiraceae bacterium]|nr:hypothetical protein [Oscillospiraceae bacterium]